MVNTGELTNRAQQLYFVQLFLDEKAAEEL